MKTTSIFILIFSFFSCNEYLYNEVELDNILGVKTIIRSEEYSYEEFSGIQGEGFLFNKYLLKEDTISEFLALDIKEQFPKQDKYKENWSLIEWKKGISLNNNTKDLLNVFENGLDFKLKNELIELKKELDIPNNYYSLFYKNSIDEPYAIELFVLNPKSKTLWVINIIT